MPSHVKPRKVIIHGHPTSVRLEPAFWYWLRIIAAECGMTAKKFIECIRIAHPNDPLSSTLRVQITNYFYSQSPRTGFVDPESKFAFRIERPRKSRKRRGRMPSHVKPRKVIIHGHPTSVRLEPAFWYWLRIIAAECGMTAKKFIECIRIAHPNDPLSSTLRVQITNYFYSQPPRTGFVDPRRHPANRDGQPRKEP